MANLAANFAQGIVSSTLARLLKDKEAELLHLQQQVSNNAPAPGLCLPDSQTLARLYREKVAKLTRLLEDEAIRPEASNIRRQIIHSVTIYPSDQSEAEVAAKLGCLIDFAANENSPGFVGRSFSYFGCGAGFTGLRPLPPGLAALRSNSRPRLRPAAIRTTKKRP